MYDGCNYKILVYYIYIYSLVGTLIKSNNNNSNNSSTGKQSNLRRRSSSLNYGPSFENMEIRVLYICVLAHTMLNASSSWRLELGLLVVPVSNSHECDNSIIFNL